MKLSVLLLCAFPLVLPAQTLVQSSIAAAGGSVAGVAGKKVSEGVDKVLGALSDVTDEAAAKFKDTDGRKTRSLPAEPALPKGAVFVPRTPASPVGRAVAPPPPRTTQTIGATRRVANVDPTLSAPLPDVPPAVAPAEIRQPNADDLQAVAAGASRAELADRMGRPSSKITMAEDGKLVEVYTYRNAGSVRLVDGAVSEVRVK